MDIKNVVNDKKTLKIYTKDELIERIIILQEYIIELKNKNSDLTKKDENNAIIINELDKLQNLEPLIKEIYPTLINIMQLYEGKSKYNKSSKGYGLVKRPNKKHGFLYYVRYYDKGRTLPTKWNTHTNDFIMANEFAKNNRERLLAIYYKKQEKNNENIDSENMFKLLKDFYSEGSIYLNYYKKLNILFSEDTRIYNNNIVNKIFIPFLKHNNIKNINEITIKIIGKFQLFLIEKNKTPNCIRKYLKVLEYIFSNLYMTGIIDSNVFESIKIIKNNKKD